MLRNLALNKEGAVSWIDANGEMVAETSKILCRRGGILGDGNRVKIDHHEDAAMMTLELYPLL